MKLSDKIFYIPLITILVVFILSIVAIERYITEQATDELKQELGLFSSVALTAFKTNEVHYKGGELLPQLDRLADKLAHNTSFHLRLYAYNGVLLGDSQLTFQQILQKNKSTHLSAKQTSLSKNLNFYQSDTESTLSVFDKDSGYILQVSAPKSIYQQKRTNMREQLFLLPIAIIVVVLLLVMFMQRAFNKQNEQKQAALQKRIALHTQELTLIQTMTLMINSVNDIYEAGNVLANIFPKLLPGYSGSLYVTKAPEKELVKVVSWGKNWPRGARVFNNEASQTKSFTLKCAPIACIEAGCHDCQLLENNCYKLNLTENNQVFGQLFLINQKEPVNQKMYQVLEELIKTISVALANVRLKVQLHEQASHDPLTGLYNRRYMHEALTKALHRADRQKTQVAVLMIDLDHFKLFNDQYGHEAGDLVLAKVAETFRENIRLEDIACRYGGEEFCIICPDTLLRDAYVLAEKLRNKIKTLSITIQGKQLNNITLSIGVAIYPSHAPNDHDLISKADNALYQAKHNGRNCTVAYQADLQAKFQG